MAGHGSAAIETRMETTTFEAEPFASRSFLAEFLRGESTAGQPLKSQRFTCMSPEVSRRLKFCSTIGSSQTEYLSAATSVTAGGVIDWTRLHLPASIEEDEMFAEGGRLAAASHVTLFRVPTSNLMNTFSTQQQRIISPDYFPLLSTLQTVRQYTLDGSDSEAYVALCVCLTLLERALFDVYRRGTPQISSRSNESTETVRGGMCEGENLGKSGDSVVPSPVMILRDLIATPQIAAALPKAMVTILKLLLLPLGFNIRNLVWHGFMAPGELPRELGSLVLMVTLDVVTGRAMQFQELESSTDPSSRPAMEHTSSMPPTLPMANLTSGTACLRADFPGTMSDRHAMLKEHIVHGEPSHSIVEAVEEDSPPPLQTTLAPLQSEVIQGDAMNDHASDWSLDSFDERLACPPDLIMSVVCLVNQEQNNLHALIRRSTFILPGREELASMALDALRKRRYMLFLVALLPVLEHGLRFVFSCKNDSPGHLFAHLRQYYSTLDGFGQRARHQLLLDQEMSGCPGRSNRLLATLGPGLSACLLDIFMMNAGPCLRGKIAHGEVDLSSIFLSPDSPPKCGGAPTDYSGSKPIGDDLVHLTAAIFIVLCSMLDPTVTEANNLHPRDRNPSRQHRKIEDNSMPLGDKHPDFDELISKCKAYCDGWIPRFHPHELLEADMQSCWREISSLALTIERRTVSIESLSKESGLARISVLVLAGDDRPASVTSATCSNENAEAYRSNEDTSPLWIGNCTDRNDELQGSSVPVVLTVTDGAHRLIAPGTEVHGGSTTAKSKGKRSGSAATVNDVPSVTLRVRRALQRHCTNLSHLFRRIHEVVENETRARACWNPVAANAVASCDAEEHALSIRDGISAFAVFIHSERCPADPACLLDCLDPGWRSNAGGAIGGDNSILEPGFVVDDRDMIEAQTSVQIDGITDTVVNNGRNGDSQPHVDGAAGKPQAIEGISGESPGGYMRNKDDIPPTRRDCCRRPRSPSRISPHTNVINVTLLPQMACLRVLCRLCLNIARGLKTRICELEAQVGLGSARSGQRRAYSASLIVAPTLLCFLASTMSAIEAFVLEWDLRHEINYTSSSACYSPVVKKRTNGIVSSGSGEGDGGNTIDGESDENAFMSADKRLPRSRREYQQQQQPCRRQSQAPLPEQDSRRHKESLAFLRRLAAVNGSLGLCVLPEASGVYGENKLAGESYQEKIGVRGNSTFCAGGRANVRSRGDGMNGRKGYVQALGELAGFLETKTAERGFSGGEFCDENV